VRVVVDTNRLKSVELWGFLSLSPDNRVVLPDYVLMEVVKPGRPEEVRAAFSILGQFPDQVVVLKGTGDVSALNPGPEPMADTMISTDETGAFPEFLHHLQQAGQNGPIDEALRVRAGWANEQMDRMLAGFADMAPAMEEFQAPFTTAELRLIRQEAEFTPDMTAKFFGLAVSMAERVFEVRTELAKPSQERRPDHYVFRHSLAYAVYMMSKVRAGARNWSGKVARNDVIDIMLAVYGTYFDGVMSHDRLTGEVFTITRDLLERTGVSVGRDYWADYGGQVLDFLGAQDESATFGGAEYP